MNNNQNTCNSWKQHQNPSHWWTARNSSNSWIDRADVRPSEDIKYKKSNRSNPISQNNSSNSSRIYPKQPILEKLKKWPKDGHFHNFWWIRINSKRIGRPRLRAPKSRWTRWRSWLCRRKGSWVGNRKRYWPRHNRRSKIRLEIAFPVLGQLMKVSGFWPERRTTRYQEASKWVWGGNSSPWRRSRWSWWPPLNSISYQRHRSTSTLRRLW